MPQVDTNTNQAPARRRRFFQGDPMRDHNDALTIETPDGSFELTETHEAAAGESFRMEDGSIVHVTTWTPKGYQPDLSQRDGRFKIQGSIDGKWSTLHGFQSRDEAHAAFLEVIDNAWPRRVRLKDAWTGKIIDSHGSAWS